MMTFGFATIFTKGGLIGIAIDPLSAHECGNQRYLAIPWLDACLSERLPKQAGQTLRNILADKAWLAPVLGKKAIPAKKFNGNPNKAIWLPNQEIAKIWMHYVRDTEIPDLTPPPTPTNIRISNLAPKKHRLSWDAQADIESGLSYFIIKKNGKMIGQVPEEPTNRYGRPLFQGLQYSDTPLYPIVKMEFHLSKFQKNQTSDYRVISVNTAGLESK